MCKVLRREHLWELKEKQKANLEDSVQGKSVRKRACQCLIMQGSVDQITELDYSLNNEKPGKSLNQWSAIN